MTKFLYTKDMRVINDLEKSGCPLLKKTEDGTFVYAVADISLFKFEEHKDVWISNTLTF